MEKDQIFYVARQQYDALAAINGAGMVHSHDAPVHINGTERERETAHASPACVSRLPHVVEEMSCGSEEGEPKAHHYFKERCCAGR